MQKGWVAGCALAFGMGAVSFSYAADDAELRLGVGADYSRGSYGTGSQSSTFSIPFTARYELDRWTYKVTVPWLEVKAPADVVPGVGRVDNSGKPKKRNFAGTKTESGLGDIVGAATYELWYDDNLERGLDLTGRVKLPTADAGKGLGTGSTDFGLQADTYRTFAPLPLFAAGGPTFFRHPAYVGLTDAAHPRIT